jgi:hypothetical protein
VSPVLAVGALAAIHRSAWKVNSKKFGCGIVHRWPVQEREDGS